MISTILLVFAFVLSALATLGVGSPSRFNLLAGALSCYFLSLLLVGK